MNTDVWMDFVIEDGDCLWFIDGNNTGLYCINKISDEIQYIAELPQNYENKIRLYNAGGKYKDKLIFAPFRAKSILIYDLKTKEFEEIYISENFSGNVQFSNVVIVDNYMIMVGTFKQFILLKVNLNDYTYKAFNFGKYLKEDSTLSRDIINVNNTIMFASMEEAILIGFNYKKEEFIAFKLDCSSGFGTIAYDGKNVWLSGRDFICKWSESIGIEKEYCNFPEKYGMQIEEGGLVKEVEGFYLEYSKWRQPFFRSCIWKDKLWLFSAEMNMSLVLDLNTEIIKECFIEGDEEKYKNNSVKNRTSILKYLCVYTAEDEIYVYSTNNKCIYKLEIIQENLKIEKITIKMKKEEWLKFFKNKKKAFSIENSTFTLENFIDMMK